MTTTLAAVGLFPSPVAAGCPQPVRDRYEAGEVVTIVGYTRGCLAVAADSSARRNQPLYGFLQRDVCAELDGLLCPAARAGHGPPAAPTGGVPLGQFVIQESTHEWRGLRMSLTFTLPTDLPAGAYVVAMCRSPCSDEVGDVGKWPIYVGVDPPPDWRPVRLWPLDDPSVQDLPDKALLLGHDGEEITAAEVRAGITMRTPASPHRRAPAPPSVRTDDTAHHSNNGRLVLWLAGVALLLLVLRAASRLGPTRKHVHHRP